MENTDLAWAAGFLDADGTFGIRVTKSGSYYASVAAAQVDPSPIRKLIELFGGRMHIDRSAHRIKPTAAMEQHRWAISSRGSLATMKLVRPFMVVKCAQADLAIALQEATSTTGGRGIAAPTPEMKAWRAEAYQLAKRLNQRGVQRTGSLRGEVDALIARRPELVIYDPAANASAWRERNRERLRAYNREYYRAHKKVRSY